MLDDLEPSVSILLSYPSKHKSVTLGNKIKPKAVTSQPIFDIFVSDTTPTRTVKDNATYTLVLTDPDATSRADPVKAQMCHWVATNITKHDNSAISGGFEHLLSLAFDKGSGDSGIHELMPYVPPSPPPKTGYHRYVFVLLAPAADAHPPKDLKKPKDRPHWGYGKVGAGVREWAEENNLVAVGKLSTVISYQPELRDKKSGVGDQMNKLICTRCQFLLLSE